MTLTELKQLLKIDPSDTSQDAYLQLMLDGAIEYVQTYCNNEFKDDSGNLAIPSGLKLIISSMVQSTQSSVQSGGQVVASKKVDDISISYATSGSTEIFKGFNLDLDTYRSGGSGGKVRFF